MKYVLFHRVELSLITVRPHFSFNFCIAIEDLLTLPTNLRVFWITLAYWWPKTFFTVNWSVCAIQCILLYAIVSGKSTFANSSSRWTTSSSSCSSWESSSSEFTSSLSSLSLAGSSSSLPSFSSTVSAITSFWFNSLIAFTVFDPLSVTIIKTRSLSIPHVVKLSSIASARFWPAWGCCSSIKLKKNMSWLLGLTIKKATRYSKIWFR